MLLAILAVLAAATPDASSAGPAAASPLAAAAQQAQPKPKEAADAPDIVCHMERVTGSMFPKKVCRRKSDAQQQKYDSQDQLRQVQRSAGPLTH